METLTLEHMNDFELRAELVQAKEDYDYYMELVKDESIPLHHIFRLIKSKEAYIRMIENLLNKYEMDRVFVRRAVKRRTLITLRREEQ